MRRIVFSPAARRDLHRIGDYTIEAFGIHQAEVTLTKVLAALESITSYPRIGRKRPELNPLGRSFRYHVVLGCFLIAYEALEDRIRVVRILDGRRQDLRGLLGGQES